MSNLGIMPADVAKIVEQRNAYEMALRYLEHRLRLNAEGKQPYGGFHTVQEEFQSIWRIAHHALQYDMPDTHELKENE